MILDLKPSSFPIVFQEYRSKPFCCAECPFSCKYYSAYKNHFRNVHRQMFNGEVLLNCPYCTFLASERNLEIHVKIFHIRAGGRVTSRDPAMSNMDRAILNRVMPERVEKAMYFCKKCTFRDSLYNVVRRHIYREHFQHIVSPYLGLVTELSVKNGASSVNGNNILCKRCQFSTSSYEALVQHVIEYHERIGAQVTTMIGHANVYVSTSQSVPKTALKAAPNAPLKMYTKAVPKAAPKAVPQPIIGYLKPAAPPVKHQSSINVSQVNPKGGAKSGAAANNPTGVNTAQTQKWKICTVCYELFPENLYSDHFENVHKAKKVWAMAKYIMKIHNFTSKCLLCNRYLPSDTLLNHMLIHGFNCPQCHSSFHNVEILMEHQSQAHPDDYVGPPGAAPLTFDLTIKKDMTSNIQLAVITFNMKESVNSQEKPAPASNSMPLQGNLNPMAGVKKSSNTLAGRSLSMQTHKSEVGKTLCPLCFTILKGPISDALATHLRERHQVLQTMHPVEKKMTYKCIHCLGVYTSNMVASTITLHLVQCRAVGRTQAYPNFKSALTLNSSGAGFLKRQPAPMQSSSNVKRIKLSQGSDSSSPVESQTGSHGLALDPRSFEHETYEARKEFLTAYFNRRPYPSIQEEDKLSASLWLWKSDISNHFATKQRTCEKLCETKKLSVLLGFDMTALKKVTHNLTFESKECFDSPLFGKPVGPNSSTQNAGLNIQPNALNSNINVRTCTETISLDSDSEPETVDKTENAENGSSHSTSQENVKLLKPLNMAED